MTLIAAHPVQRVSIADQTYQLVRDSIVEGVCSPGELLDVEDIALVTGASRTPVLSALERLHQVGLADRKYRYFVVKPTAHDAELAVVTLNVLVSELTDDESARRAVREAVARLDDASGKAEFGAAHERITALCRSSPNHVLAEIVEHRLDSLLYRARFIERDPTATRA